jgi:hypothetical protein
MVHIGAGHMPKDVLFVQFYYDNYHNNNASVILDNGFQNVYHDCINVGDFLWVRHFETEHEMEKNRLPIHSGTVYVSAFYYDHLIQAYIWARQYPQIKFIIGGPAVRYGNYTCDQKPRNLLSNTGLAEEVIFGKSKPNKQWAIDIPKELIKDKKEVRFSYNLDRRCYWGKCIYCDGYVKSQEKSMNNDMSNLHIPDIDIRKMIRLNIPSMPPVFFSKMLKKLPRRSDVIYDFFVRGGEETIPHLTSGMKQCENGNGPGPDQFRWVVGIEWPSDRMLAYMKKGTTNDHLLQLLRLAGKYQVPVGMPFIFGWNNLTKDDVLHAKQFINEVEEIPNLQTSCVGFTLEVHPSTPLYHKIDKAELIPAGKKLFNNGECRVKLKPEQHALNEDFKQFFLSSKLNTYLYDSEIGNVDVG